MAPNEAIPHIYVSKTWSWVTNDGNHVVVSNPSEIISTIAPLIRANASVLETQGVNEKLDPQHGEL